MHQNPCPLPGHEWIKSHVPYLGLNESKAMFPTRAWMNQKPCPLPGPECIKSHVPYLGLNASKAISPTRAWMNQKPCPLPGPECINAFRTSAFIVQTYHVSHKEVLLINCSDSDSKLMQTAILIQYLVNIEVQRSCNLYCNPAWSIWTLRCSLNWLIFCRSYWT